MDWQNVINIGAGAALGGIGWFARQLWDAVEDLKAEIVELKLRVSDGYVKKTEIDMLKADMDRRFDKLEILLARQFDKIDAKVDK